MAIETKAASLQQIADQLKAADDFVICGHVSPDGDCLGSVLALGHALRAMGKKATCLLAREEHIDYGLRFLPGIDDMVVAADYVGQVGTFISLDVPNADRMGLDAAYLHSNARDTICVDHHQSEEPMARLTYSDEHAPATALLVWRLIELMGVQRDERIACCCYTGLVTDTGRFAYQNATAEAFEAASQMVDAGAVPAQVSQQVYYNRSRASLSLEKRMLSRVEYLCNGAVAISHLKRSDFVETNAIKADAEPMIDILRSVRGVRVACMLREQDGQVRGSLRAKDATDVSVVAAKFEGGGHKAAAGFTVRGSMNDALRLVKKELTDLF